MRSSLLVLTMLALTTTVADARPKHHGRPKREEASTPQRPRGQSIGAPWEGELVNGTQLPKSDRYILRHPGRTWGTRSTVRHLREAIRDTLLDAKVKHTLAIGDLSAEGGGWITDHHSHQAGRDVDVGLFYRKVPAAYPEEFVSATESNLDKSATWALIRNLVKSEDDDGGVMVIFLDFEVQGMLYRWAKDHGVSEKRLDHVFQYPHGRGASAGIVRHEPNHRNHLHVRYRCTSAERSCRSGW